jgi:hypothetical protein
MIDTLKLSKGLQKAGMSEAQADSITEALTEAQSEYLTSTDLKTLENRLVERFNGTDAKIVTLEGRLGRVQQSIWLVFAVAVLQLGTTLGPVLLKAISGH